MGELIRPRFGHPCFVCRVEPVPPQRVAFLRSEAALARRRFLKSDILCVHCDRLRDRDGATVEPRR
jgi:hypothetical protein